MDTTTRQTTHTLGWISTVLVVIGALNWLLVGAFRVDLVASIFGPMSWLSRLIYVLVGLAGLYEIYFTRQLTREAQGRIPTTTAPRAV